MFAAGRRLYAVAARSSPPSWSSWGGKHDPDAALFESTDGGDAFEAVSYPGGPEEFILAWTALDEVGDVFAGSRGGYILRRAADEWTKVGNVSATIPSLVVV